MEPTMHTSVAVHKSHVVYDTVEIKNRTNICKIFIKP